MRFAILLTLLALNFNALADCPEETYPDTIYNTCKPSEDRVCALWYSKTICVKDPIICTMDFNPWGHPSACICGSRYFYNPILGKCRLKDDLSCSKDINEWGFPSYCICDEGFAYDPTRGSCLIKY